MERFVLQTTASEIESIFSVKVTSESLINSTFNAAPGHLLPAIFQRVEIQQSSRAYGIQICPLLN